MRTAFDQNYFDKAYGGEYEKRNPARKLRYYLAEILRIKTSGSLLDVGCAYGSFLSHARQYYNVTGIDISREAIDGARTPGSGQNPGLEGKQGILAGQAFRTRVHCSY